MKCMDKLWAEALKVFAFPKPTVSSLRKLDVPYLCIAMI